MFLGKLLITLGKILDKIVDDFANLFHAVYVELAKIFSGILFALINFPLPTNGTEFSRKYRCPISTRDVINGGGNVKHFHGSLHAMLSYMAERM